MADDEAVDLPRNRASPRRLLELFVLCSFAIAQPLLDVTGRSPETFVFYRVDGMEVVVYALLIVVVPPIALWLAITGLALMSPRLGLVLHIATAIGLTALTVVQAGKKATDLRGPVLVVAALVIAGGALWLVARSGPARSFVTYLIPAPLVFILLFILASPTGALVQPADSERSVTGSTRGAASAPPVVMILLDELPLMSLLNSTGEVDERVFPNFARLARSSNWYRNGTAVSAFTQYAVPSMLTGRYPEKQLAPSYAQHPDNLFSLLAPDYRIRAFETITQLCDPALCDEAADPVDSGRGFRGLFDQTWQVAKKMAQPYDSAPISDLFAEESAGEPKKSLKPRVNLAQTKPNWKSFKANQPERFQKFLAGLRADDEPTMHFLHLLLPHKPWRYLPSGATHPAKIFGTPKGAGPRNVWPATLNHQQHLLQLAYTDHLIGDVIDRMKAQGLWDEALVVVTADHGEAFTPRLLRRLHPRADLAAQIGWVPVFLKEPNQSRGTINDGNWEHVDLLPTMADALGREVPFPVDGISQLSQTRAREEKHFYNYPGQRITFPGPPAFAVVLHGFTDTVVRGSRGEAGLYQTGSRPDWIGKRVSGLTGLGVEVVRKPSQMTARLAEYVNFRDVDPAAGSVPALVHGTLSRSATHGSVLIAVNGTVAAVSQIWPDKGKPSFAGLVNDELFQRGANHLALYEVVGHTAPELRPITIR